MENQEKGAEVILGVVTRVDQDKWIRLTNELPTASSLFTAAIGCTPN